MTALLDEFLSLLKTSKTSNICIFIHNNADPDAVGAAFSFKSLINNLQDGLDIKIYSDGVNQSALKAMNDLGLDLAQNDPQITETTVIVTLDTANFVQLGRYR